jgi:hypothetical protein
MRSVYPEISFGFSPYSRLAKVQHPIDMQEQISSDQAKCTDLRPLGSDDKAEKWLK